MRTSGRSEGAKTGTPFGLGKGSAAAAQGRGEAGDAAPLDDREAVELARRGDHEAFRVLVERHQGRIYRLALRVLRDEEWARDAAQEAFLKAYRSLDRFEGRSSFTTWMYRLTVNQCLDMKRRDRSDRADPWEDDRLPAVEAGLEARHAGPAPDPAVAAERRQLGGLIGQAIEQLPSEARQTLLLREVDGLSYAEIAEALGIPKGTVMSRLHHARRRVAAELEKLGVRPGEQQGAQPGEQQGAQPGEESAP